MNLLSRLQDSITWPLNGNVRSQSASKAGHLSGDRHRIGLLIDSLIGGGAERVTLNLARAFSQLGHDVHIFVLKNEVQYELPDDLQIHALSEQGKLFGNKFINRLALAWRLLSAVDRIQEDGRRFDFFVTNAEDSDRISAIAGLEHVFIRYRNSMAGYLNSKVGRRTGLKRLWHELKWHAHFRAVYGGRNIITVSNALHQDIVRDAGVHPRSLHTIYNPFDFEHIRCQAQEYEPEIEGAYIIYLARFNQRKRQDLLLEAFAQSAARHSHKLVLMGDAYTESEQHWHKTMLAKVQSMGLSDRVVFPGFQSNPFPWIKRADLFAMSSDNEGLPTVLIEALILGTPVVCTDCPTGPAEILTGELAAYLCPCNDAAALAARIDTALSSYPEITDAGLARFDARHVAWQYLYRCSSRLQSRQARQDARLLRRATWWA